VHFENQVITASVANLGTLIDAAKIKNRNEAVYALVKVVSTEEDQVNRLLPLRLLLPFFDPTGSVSHPLCSWR
jgi:hypothetical protein